MLVIALSARSGWNGLKMPFCGEATVIGTEGATGFASLLCCRRWGCSHCDLINRRKVAKLIRDLEPTHFVTITDSPHWHGSPDEAAQVISSDWSGGRRHLRRKLKGKLDFVAVFEATERGWPHLHIAVADCPVPAVELERLILEWLGEPAGSPRVKVLPVTEKDGGFAGLASYMTEAPALFRGCRRFWTNRGWRVPVAVVRAAREILAVLQGRLEEAERIVRGAGRAIVDRTPFGFTFDPPMPPP